MRAFGVTKSQNLACWSSPRWPTLVRCWKAMLECSNKHPVQDLVKCSLRNSNRTGRFHRVEGGKYLANRTGYRICEAYNTSQLTETSQGVWCQHNWDTVHQCDRCLRSHPTVRCPHQEMPTPGFLQKSSKGKGKDGKGHGKKGDDLNTDHMMWRWGTLPCRQMTACSWEMAQQTSHTRWIQCVLALRFQNLSRCQIWRGGDPFALLIFLVDRRDRMTVLPPRLSLWGEHVFVLTRRSVIAMTCWINMEWKELTQKLQIVLVICYRPLVVLLAQR